MEKIYRGMASGAEKIDGNFNEINNNFSKKDATETISGNKTFTGDMTVRNISASGSLTSKIVSTKMDTPAIKHTFIRVGNMVTLTTETKSDINQATSYTIPSGYRPFNDGSDPIYEQVLNGGKSAVIRSSVAKWQPRPSDGLNPGLFGTISWPTNDPFPK